MHIVIVFSFSVYTCLDILSKKILRTTKPGSLYTQRLHLQCRFPMQISNVDVHADYIMYYNCAVDDQFSCMDKRKLGL